jgi:nucleoside-diphosphate-sugar epimerase
MRLLITGSGGLLGAALIAALGADHQLVTVDLPGSAGAAPTYTGDLRDREFAARVTAGCDAIIHLLPEADGEASGELLDAATRATYNLLTTTRARRFVLVSSLRIFERYPSTWRVNEWWAPRPTADLADLAPYLAEVTTREVARSSSRPFTAIALRMGEVVDDANVHDGAGDPRWLHVDDAVQAVARALSFTPGDDEPESGWWAFHIVGGGQRTRFPLGLAGQPPFGYAPRHDVGGAERAVVGEAVSRPRRYDDRSGGTARRVVVYGAGGPLAAATTAALRHDHLLRLTDVAPFEEIVARAEPQSPGAPLPILLQAPHETAVVDVTDYAQVLAAAADMDAIINCTVVRPDPVAAFRVNMLGAYNVMRAAVAHGIRRVVHTGPFQLGLQHPTGYWYDWDLEVDVPARPGDQLYILTKLLGQEICRVFAVEHGLEVPALLFCNFVAPESPPADPLGLFPFSVSWEDAAAAMRQALHAPSFPHPFELFHILADLPQGKYRNDKAKQLLAWQPRDRMENHWTR